MTDEHRTPDPAAREALPDWLQEVTGEASGDAPKAVPARFSTSTLVMLGMVLAIVAVIGYAMIDRERKKATPKQGPAPAFEVTMYDFAFMARSGETVSLASLRGQAIVINFWASYCVPCQREAAMLQAVWNDYKDRGVIFLGINTEDPQQDALDYLVEYGITYPNAPDRGEKMESAYRITGIPETFVISTRGEIVQHFLSEPNERDFRAAIDRALQG